MTRNKLIDWIQDLFNPREKLSFQGLSNFTKGLDSRFRAAFTPIRKSAETLTEEFGDYLSRRIPGTEEFKSSWRPTYKKLESYVPGGFKAGLGRIKTAYKKDPGQFNVLNILNRNQARIGGRQLEQAGFKWGDELGAGLEGAAQIPFLKQVLRPPTTAATPELQKWQDLGRYGTGSALTLATGGLGTLGAGSLLGGGFETAEKLITEKRLPTAKELLKGAAETGSEGFLLVATNALADKIAGRYFPGIVSKKLSQTPSGFIYQKIKRTLKLNFQRAILETPIEGALFTALDYLEPDNKKKFLETFQTNMWGSLIGNVAFAGINSAFKSADYLTKNQRGKLGGLIKTSFNKTMDQLKKTEGFVNFEEIAKPVKKLSDKFASNINLNRLKQTPEQKKTMVTNINKIKPELEAIKGKKMSNQEILNASAKSGILQQVTSRDETLEDAAMMLNARKLMNSLNSEIERLKKTGNTKQTKAKLKEFIEIVRVVSSKAADKGRQLQALKTEAGEETIKQKIIKDILKIETDTDKIAKEALKVDWEDADSIATFYRKFIKATGWEVLNEYRYTNMLSNPRTHLRNAFSNVLQTFVIRPAVKTLAEGPISTAKYYKGVIKAFPEAVEGFKRAAAGKDVIEKPDLKYTTTKKLPKFYTQ